MSENLFGNTAPTNTNLADAAPGLTLGTRIHFAVAGTITGLRWRCPDTLPGGTVQWFVIAYDPTLDAPAGGLANGTFSSLTAGQYNTVSFTAVPVNAGDEIVCEIWTPDRYVSTPNFFTSDVVSGNLTGPADSPGTTPPRRNGRFNSGSTPQFPQSGFNASAYFVDVVFTASGASSAAPNGIAVAVALGQPTTSIPTVAPTGPAVPVALGQPSTGLLGTAPPGIAVPVALGQPAAALRGVTPTGVTVPVHLGTPGGIPGRDIDLTVGPPRLRWRTAPPHARWRVRAPRT